MYRHWVFKPQRDSYDTRCKNDHHNLFAFYNDRKSIDPSSCQMHKIGRVAIKECYNDVRSTTAIYNRDIHRKSIDNLVSINDPRSSIPSEQFGA